jgi:hypothetical protein
MIHCAGMSEADEVEAAAEVEEPGWEEQRQAREVGKGKRRFRRRSTRVSFCTLDCKYDVVKEAAAGRGFRMVPHDDDRCNIYWWVGCAGGTGGFEGHCGAGRTIHCCGQSVPSWPRAAAVDVCVGGPSLSWLHAGTARMTVGIARGAWRVCTSTMSLILHATHTHTQGGRVDH